MHRFLFSLSIIAYAVLAGTPPSLAQENARGTTLRIFATGQWKGRIGPDRNGAGGAASLYTHIKRNRTTLSGRGRAFLLFVGDLSGSQKKEDFENLLTPPGIHLTRRLGVDAVLPSPGEAEILNKGENPDFRIFPGVSFSANSTPAVRKFRILKSDKYNLFITGFPENISITKEKVEMLRKEMLMQTGIDLFIILSSRNNKSESSFLSSGEFHKILSGDAPMNQPELSRSNDPIIRTIIIESGYDRTDFKRLSSGAFHCTIHNREICEITSVFRDHKLLSIEGRGYQINAQNSPLPYIPPNRTILQYYPPEH